MKKIILSKVSKLIIAALFFSISLSACGEKTDYKKKGIDALNDGDYEKACDYFDKALDDAGYRVTDNEIDISYYKASAEYLSGDREKAEETFTNLIEFDKKNPDAYYLRGLLYLTENELEKAKKDFDKSIELKPDDFRRYLEIYEALEGVSLQDDGKVYLQKAIAVNGSSSEDLLNRGKIYEILGQDEVAEQAYKKSVDKGNTTANLYLAMLYDSKGQTDDAESALNEFIKKGKETAKTDSVISAYYINRKDYDNAIKYIEKGMALNDSASEQPLLKNYITLLEHTGNFDKAYEETSKYIKLYPFDTVMMREYTFLSSRVSNVNGSGAEAAGSGASGSSGTSTGAASGAENASGAGQ